MVLMLLRMLRWPTHVFLLLFHGTIPIHVLIHVRVMRMVLARMRRIMLVRMMIMMIHTTTIGVLWVWALGMQWWMLHWHHHSFGWHIVHHGFTERTRIPRTRWLGLLLLLLLAVFGSAPVGRFTSIRHRRGGR